MEGRERPLHFQQPTLSARFATSAVDPKPTYAAEPSLSAYRPERTSRCLGYGFEFRLYVIFATR